MSFFSFFGLPTFGISIRRSTFLLGSPRAWMESYAYQGPLARIDASLRTNQDQFPKLAGNYPLTAMMRRRPKRISWVLSIRSALVVIEQRWPSVWLLHSTCDILSWSDWAPEKFVIQIREIVRYIWELVVCEFDIWWILSHISMAPCPQGTSLPLAKMRTWTKGVGFQYTHLRF
jgi:hypothetical protein